VSGRAVLARLVGCGRVSGAEDPLSRLTASSWWYGWRWRCV